MEVVEQPADEIKRLRRCVNDLVSVIALPAIWSGGGAAQMIGTVTDVLVDILDLDFIYVRLENPPDGAPVETVRFAQSQNPVADAPEIGKQLHRVLGREPRAWPVSALGRMGGDEVAIAPLRLGLEGEIGLIVAGIQRRDFPTQSESLLLRVAANQIVIGLQEARLLNEQKRVARELDERVAHRTRELAQANEQLKREIGERKHAEEKLRQSESFLATGQRLSRTGSFSWRVATGEIIWSEELYRIFDFDENNPITIERITARVHPEDIPLLNDVIDRVQRAAGDFEYEHRLLMPDQTIKYIHLTAHAARGQQGELIYLGAARDVTRRRLAEETLGKVRSQLAHAARVTSLGALTASIAHEVNQPLTAIANNANASLNLLPDSIANLQEVRAALAEIIEDAERASAVVARVRHLVRKEPFSKALLNLRDIVTEVLALAHFESAAQHVMIRMELSEDVPLVMADRVQLQQVLLNLIVNAMDAMKSIHQSQRILTIRAKAQFKSGVPECLVCVEDTGIGLDLNETERLFEAFHITKPHGMGMGLAVSRSIIEAHGGRLWAEPNQGAGATFLFTLPAAGIGTA